MVSFGWDERKTLKEVKEGKPMNISTTTRQAARTHAAKTTVWELKVKLHTTTLERNDYRRKWLDTLKELAQLKQQRRQQPVSAMEQRRQARARIDATLTPDQIRQARERMGI